MYLSKELKEYFFSHGAPCVTWNNIISNGILSIEKGILTKEDFAEINPQRLFNFKILNHAMTLIQKERDYDALEAPEDTEMRFRNDWLLLGKGGLYGINDGVRELFLGAPLAYYECPEDPTLLLIRDLEANRAFGAVCKIIYKKPETLREGQISFRQHLKKVAQMPFLDVGDFRLKE